MAFDGVSVRHITLLKVAGMLRERAFRGVAFDMAAFGGFCGTAACIAGHCVLLENPSATFDDVQDELRDAPPRLRALYNVVDARGVQRWDDQRANQPEFAARAIDNYLAGAELPWAGVLF